MSSKYLLEINNLTNEKKEWLACAICGMACADGIIDKVELEFLKKALGFIGKKETVIAMIEIVKKKEIPELKNLKDCSRTEAFRIYLFIGKLALSDARLTIEEIDFLRQVGTKLGFSKLICEKMNQLIMNARNLIRDKEETDKEKNDHWEKQVDELQAEAEAEEAVWL